MGQRPRNTTLVVKEVSELATLQDEVMADGVITPLEAARVRRKVAKVQDAAQLADWRQAAADMITHDVGTISYAELKLARAHVLAPLDAFDLPLDAA